MKTSAFIAFNFILQTLGTPQAQAAPASQCDFFIHDARPVVNKAQRRLDRVIMNKGDLSRHERDLFARTQRDINDMRRSIGDAQRKANDRPLKWDRPGCDRNEAQFRADKRDFEDHLNQLIDAIRDRRDRTIVIERYHSPFNPYGDGYWDYRNRRGW